MSVKPTGKSNLKLDSFLNRYKLKLNGSSKLSAVVGSLITCGRSAFARLRIKHIRRKLKISCRKMKP